MSVVRVPRVLRAAAVAVAGAAMASACGARSALEVNAGATSGGAGTTVGGGGTGGAGGMAVELLTTCGMAAQVNPVLTVDAPDEGDGLQPSLVVLPASTPPQAAVAYVWQPSAIGSFTSARVASFDGWGAWPPTLTYANVQNTETGLPESGVTLLAQTDPSVSPPSFDLLYVPTQMGTQNFSNTPLTCFGVGVDGSTPLIQVPAGGAPVFLATGAASGLAWPEAVNLLVGVVQGGSPLFSLFATPGANFGGGAYSMGCATSAVAADAVPSETGWLVTAGLGSPLALGPKNGLSPCADVGPGTNLMLGTLSSSLDTLAFAQTVQVFQAASPFTRIRMANRPGGGTWIVWSADGEPSLTAGVVSSALALGTTFPIVAAGGTLAPTSFAIDAFGTELVVAFVEPMPGGDDQVQVVAMDETGTTRWFATGQTGGTVVGALSLRAAPDGSSLLLAWSELPQGATTHRLRVARLDCSTCAPDGAGCAAASDCCGGRCDHGTCATPVTLVGELCTSDAVCAQGGGVCDPALGVCVGSTLCKSDADCTWATDLCIASSSTCSPGGDACTKDTDCPAGERCDPSKGGFCLPGTCAATGGSCASDHDCCNLVCDPASGSCE